jgi:hypothetical protein
MKMYVGLGRVMSRGWVWVDGGIGILDDGFWWVSGVLRLDSGVVGVGVGVGYSVSLFVLLLD